MEGLRVARQFSKETKSNKVQGLVHHLKVGSHPISGITSDNAWSINVDINVLFPIFTDELFCFKFRLFVGVVEMLSTIKLVFIKPAFHRPSDRACADVVDAQRYIPSLSSLPRQL